MVDARRCADPAALLTPPKTTLPPCLAAVRPKLSRSKMAGLGVNRAKDLPKGDIPGDADPR